MSRTQNWIDRVEAGQEPAEPELTWKAVRAAIFEAGKGGAQAQDNVKNIFYNLTNATAVEADKKLKKTAELYASMGRGASFGGRVDYAQTSAAIENARVAMHKAMGVSQGVGCRAA